MKLIFKIPKCKAGFSRIIGCNFSEYSFFKSVIILLLLFSVFSLKAQIKVPNMMVPNGTWGLIDVNNLYGGCMQVDTHQKMLETDVQFIKRGMLFVVYDDDLSKPGAQTRVYVFIPQLSGVKSWPFNSPFDIPQTKQNNNIITAGLSNFLFPLNISSNTDPGNKMNVYYDSTTNQFYKYDDSTDPATYVVITPKAQNISVVAQNGITSTNVQAALEELQAKVDDNGWFEYSIATDGDANVPSLPAVLPFKLKANSLIFYNGSLLSSNQWQGNGTTTLVLNVPTLVFDRIRIQR